MAKTLKLWVDADTGSLYQSFNSSSSLPSIEFLQGDRVQVEVHMVKILNGFMSEVDFPENSILRMAIGKIDASATSGTYTISYGGDTTAPILFSATESQIQTALNALASITSAGGVTVVKFSNSLYKVSFNQVGVRTLFTIDGSLLTPPCSTRSVSLKAGSVTDKGEFLIKVKQSPVAFQNSFEDIDPPSITATVLTANQSKRVTISPEPKGGTWAITGTGDLQRKVQLSNDGLLDPDWWDENYTARVSVNAFSSDTQFSYLNYDVVKVDSYTWDFSLKSYATPPVGYTMPFTVSGSGLIGYSGKIGSLDLNTAEVEYLLNGASSVTTNLELELEELGGNKKTLLQTTCTIKNDLIDQNDYSPISYGDSNIYWGEIGGTITTQTDLQSALDGKLSLTGGTVTGTVSFTDPENTTIEINPADGWVKIINLSGGETALGNGVIDVTNGDGVGAGMSIQTDKIRFPDLTEQTTAGLPLTGGTLTGKLSLNVDGTTTAPLNLKTGITPTTPLAGDLWILNDSLNYRNTTGVTRIVATTGNNNAFTNYQSITASNNANPALTIIQNGNGGGLSVQNPTGTGFSFKVEDSTSPDSTPFTIDASGRTGIGVTPDATSALNVDSTGIKFNGSTAQTVPYIPTDVLLKADNLSGLGNTATARTNLGLGSMATETASNYALLSGATFTGKVNVTRGTGNVPLNLGITGTPTAFTIGDVWISGLDMRFRDSAGATKILISTGNSNAFTTNQSITATNATLPSLAVTQTSAGGGVLITNTGAGYSFKVEDSTSPDATPFAIDQNGRTGIGVAPDATVALAVDSTGIKFNGSTAQTVPFLPPPSDGNYYVYRNGTWTAATIVTNGGINYLTV